MTSPIRVLHVDDDPEFVELAATFLERASPAIEVVTETAAEDGLARLAAEPVDCVVSDYDMPGMDGLEFLEAVREAHPTLPFVLFTGKGGEEVASEAISLGVTDYLQKRPGTDQYAVLANRVSNVVAGHRAEARAEHERVRFESLATAANVGILVIDEASVVRFANPAVEDLLGYPPEALVGEPVTTVMPERLRAAHLEAVRAYLETGERTLDWGGVELPGRHRDGHEVALSISFGEFERDGERYFTGVVREAPDDGEYRTLLEAVADPLFLLSPSGRVRMANEAMASRLGYEREALVGAHVSEFVPEADVERGTKLVRELLDGGGGSASFETGVTGGDGEERLVEVNLSVLTEDGEHVGTAGSVRDVTERDRTVRELTQQRSLFRAVLETSIDGVLVVDDHREHVTWNDRFLEMWGLDAETLRTEPERSVLDGLLDELADPDEFIEKVEYLYEHPDEESRDQIELADGRVFDRYSAPVTVEDGTDRGRVWFFRDVTDRRRRERAIEALQTVTRELMAADSEAAVAELAVSAVRDVLDMPINSVWLAGEGRRVLRPVAWTERATEVLGDIPEFRPGDSLAWRAYETGESRAYEDVSTEPGRYDPETPVRAELILPLGDAGVLVAGSTEPGAFDETDLSLGEILAANAEAALERARRQAEVERQNDRLDEFASIVSHDLRNPLNVAEGRLTMAMADHESEHHAAAAGALKRMRDLIDDLLTLARTGERVDEPEPVGLGALADACWDNVPTHGADLAVTTDTVVRADRSRLAQLLENLFRNAVEHGGDQVTVTVGDLDGGFFVEDDGVGIPAADREAVFESGFSGAADGTGFGLAIVRGIAEAHGWEVRATAAEGGGARFEVTGVDVTG